MRFLCNPRGDYFFSNHFLSTTADTAYVFGLTVGSGMNKNEDKHASVRSKAGVKYRVLCMKTTQRFDDRST